MNLTRLLLSQWNARQIRANLWLENIAVILTICLTPRKHKNPRICASRGKSYLAVKAASTLTRLPVM